MLTQYCIFLRGVNVNGIKIRMADLKLLLADAGYKNVITILATGNVILETNSDTRTLKALQSDIESLLSTHYKYDAHIFIKTPEEVKQILEEANTHNIADNHHHYLLISNDLTLAKDLRSLYDSFGHHKSESLITDTHGIYWVIPKGETLNSEFGNKVLGKPSYKSRLTSRTMNTIVKVANKLK